MYKSVKRQFYFLFETQFNTKVRAENFSFSALICYVVLTVFCGRI